MIFVQNFTPPDFSGWKSYTGKMRKLWHFFSQINRVNASLSIIWAFTGGINDLISSTLTFLEIKRAFSFIYIVNRVVSGEIYTAGKNFTFPLGWTNLTSMWLCMNVVLACPRWSVLVCRNWLYWLYLVSLVRRVIAISVMGDQRLKVSFGERILYQNADQMMGIILSWPFLLVNYYLLILSVQQIIENER